MHVCLCITVAYLRVMTTPVYQLRVFHTPLSTMGTGGTSGVHTIDSISMFTPSSWGIGQSLQVPIAWDTCSEMN